MVAEEDDPSFTRLTICNNGSWGMLADISDIVYSLEKRPMPMQKKPNLCVLGRNGFFREYVAGAKPIDLPIHKKDVSYLEDIKLIGNNLYACGGQNQLYKLDGQIWRDFDHAIYSPFKGKLEKCLLSIDGYSDQDIYAVGERGAVWHWNGHKWSNVDAPTNLSLNCVKCMANGDVFICGDGGALFRLNQKKQWLDLSNPEITTRSLWDIAEYEGFCYVTAENKLLRTDGDSIEEINIPTEQEAYFYSIDALEENLWIVGGEEVYQYNGKSWQVLICPDNR